MEIHKLLARQLNRLQFKTDELPADLEKWQEFVLRINKTYQEADQDRYLIERSMDISSREMQMLNEKLEEAQHIAGLGYWHYDIETDHAVWSKELYRLISLDPLKPAPSYKEFMTLVHPDDRRQLETLVSQALQDQVNYECETRIRNAKHNYHWFKIICHCQDPGKLAGIVIDIHKAKEAEEKIHELNKQFMQSARRAGMSEVATSILHNIGNILNSSNLSVNILKESFAQPYNEKMAQIIYMIQQNAEHLGEYFTEDAKGKLIPQYLIALSGMISGEHNKCLNEVHNIDKDLRHIKDIVSMQQCISGVPGLNEKIFIPELLDTALQLSINVSRDNTIKVKKERIEPLFIVSDKSKLLQILVNLIHNAKDAVISNLHAQYKEIEFEVKNNNEDAINILIHDNGVGIEPQNLDKIFSFGFTTKENGHGFGLHSSALSTQEMGGSLIAESKGQGKGATFILTLPSNYNYQKRIFNE